MLKRQKSLTHQETHNAKKLTLRQIREKINPSNYAHLSWYDIFAKEDPVKARKLALLQLRIVHIICLATIPAAIIGLIFILNSRNFVPDTTLLSFIVAVVIFYLVSFLMIFLGYKWTKTPKWLLIISITGLLIELYSTSKHYPYLVLLMNHIFRTFFCFETVLLFGFIPGMIGDSLYPAIPLFLLATVALIMTFPTNIRTERWLAQQGNTL